MDMTLEERRETRVVPHFPCESELWAKVSFGQHRHAGLVAWGSAAVSTSPATSIHFTCDHSHLTPPAPAPWSHDLRLQMKRVTANEACYSK